MELPEQLLELGGSGPLRDQLVAAVLAGDKTATSALRAQWDDEGEPLPTIGQRLTMINSAGAALALVEVTDVKVIALGDADIRLAHDEGEGFETVEQWRRTHEEFWEREVLPELRMRSAVELDDQIEVVAVWFEVVAVV